MGGMPTLWSPCCFGITLQQGVQLIATVNLVSAAFIFLYLIIAIAGIGLEEAFVFGILWLILSAFYVGVKVLLLMGANQRSMRLIKIYLIIMGVLFTLGVILSLSQGPYYIGLFLIKFLTFLPFFYQLWVVFCFYKELRDGGPPGGVGTMDMGHQEQMY